MYWSLHWVRSIIPNLTRSRRWFTSKCTVWNESGGPFELIQTVPEIQFQNRPLRVYEIVQFPVGSLIVWNPCGPSTSDFASATIYWGTGVEITWYIFPFNETYKVNSKNRRIRKGWNKPDCFSWAKSLHNRILSKKCHLKQDYAQISKIFGYFWRTRRIFSHIFILFRRLFYFLSVYGMPNRLLPRFSQRKN